MLKRRTRKGGECIGWYGKKLIEHGERIAELISKFPRDAQKKSLSVPLSIRLLQKCARYHISGDVIKRLHYTDLLLVIMELDIAEYESAARFTEQKSENQHVSGKDAVAFLKGI